MHNIKLLKDLQVKNNTKILLLVMNGLGGLPVRMVSQSASRQNLTIVVAGQDLPSAMTRLHDRFFPAVDADACEMAGVTAARRV